MVEREAFTAAWTPEIDGECAREAEIGNIGAEKFSNISKSQAMLTMFVQKSKDYHVFVKLFSYNIDNRLADITNICIIFLGPSLDFSSGVVDYLAKKFNLVIGESKMSERPGRSSGVIGPAGQPLTVETLPPRNTVRWVVRRKAEVVAAVRNGLIGLDEACERYRLSVEEFLNWERLGNAHGLRGLRVTRTQAYRQSARDDNPAQRLSQDGIGRGTSDS